MTGHGWVDLVLGAIAGLIVCWLLLMAVLVVGRPQGPLLWEALRLLPDLLKLLRRLAADTCVPFAARARIVLLMAYLAAPIDLVPDFIPVIGYADDVIVVALVLRSVVRRAGVDAIRDHWPGTDDGFAALQRLVGLSEPSGLPDARRAGSGETDHPA